MQKTEKNGKFLISKAPRALIRENTVIVIKEKNGFTFQIEICKILKQRCT